MGSSVIGKVFWGHLEVWLHGGRGLCAYVATPAARAFMRDEVGF
jgi:hypothetical protein